MLTMYPAMVNSPQAATVGALTNTGTTVQVTDGGIFSAVQVPYPITFGTGSTAETCLLTAVSGNNLTFTRGFQGVARAWDAGTVVARNFTAYDHDTFRANITEAYDTARVIPDMRSLGFLLPTMYSDPSAYDNLYSMSFDPFVTTPYGDVFNPGSGNRFFARLYVPAGASLGGVVVMAGGDPMTYTEIRAAIYGMTGGLVAQFGPGSFSNLSGQYAIRGSIPALAAGFYDVVVWGFTSPQTPNEGFLAAPPITTGGQLLMLQTSQRYGMISGAMTAGQSAPSSIGTKVYTPAKPRAWIALCSPQA